MYSLSPSPPSPHLSEISYFYPLLQILSEEEMRFWWKQSLIYNIIETTCKLCDLGKLFKLSEYLASSSVEHASLDLSIMSSGPMLGIEIT